MPIKFRENSSIRRLAKRVSKLEGAVQQLTKAVRYDVGRDATQLHLIEAFQTRLRELQVCSRRLQEASKGTVKLVPYGYLAADYRL